LISSAPQAQSSVDHLEKESPPGTKRESCCNLRRAERRPPLLEQREPGRQPSWREGHRRWSNHAMNRCLCQKPPWRGDGGSCGSSTQNKTLLESGLSGVVSDLHLLRPGATLLQPGLARRRQHRAANRRHQRSVEGRLDHRDRQKRYRRRRSIKSVMDHGSQTTDSPSLSKRGRVIRQEIAAQIELRARGPMVFELRCVVCGRLGRLLDPFPRISTRR
jgi:hypothetical protein